jgi:hypothetical protein
VARTDLTKGNSTANALTYSTASIAPGSNRVALAFVMNVRASPGPAVEPTAQGNALTWKTVGSVQVAAAPNRRLTCFRATGATPTPGPLNFDFGGEQQTLCAWSVFEYDGTTDVAQVETSGGGTPMPSITLNALADPNKSIVVGGVIVNSLFGAPAQVQPGQGCTEIHEEDVAEAGTGGSLQTEDRTGGGTTINWTAFAQGWAAIALELKIGTGIPGTAPDPAAVAALAAQFEPVMFLHSSEKFFPCDAKAYIQKCELWGAVTPFDAKASWGSTPLIAKGKIETTDSTAPTYLGLAGNLVDNPGAERFFDLSGWKDAAGMAEPTVTPTSKNTYSERNAVAALYDSDPALKASKFWYHAELFDNARLRRLLSAATPDLVKVLDSPELNGPALLCYYFFFPAHEEALASCTNIEAKEFGSFAGEWACMALLLGHDGADKPSFIGQTGRLLSPIPGVSLPPLTDDGQDAARRIVMKVNKFAEATSIDGHPALFVANGTHSLYLQAGTVAVTYPADSRPYACGRAESPPPAGEPPMNQHGGAVFYGKLLLAAELAQAWGLALSVVWIILEGAKPHGGVEAIGTAPAGDNAMPDVTGQPGSNQFVRPQSVPPQNVIGAGTELGTWQSTVVDRGKQVWWPGDSPGSGYRGRWGPRVATDPFGRRAGMRFPNVWSMFFLAYGIGKSAGTL